MQESPRFTAGLRGLPSLRATDFNQLCALARVARHGSFSAAASELGLSRSSLSQMIRDLEDRLAIPLLQRTTRSVHATSACEVLLAGFEPALAEMQGAIEAAKLSVGVAAGQIRLHVQRLAYELHVQPNLASFIDEYPEIELDVAVDDAPVDIVASGFDAGIRFTEMLDQDAIAVRLGESMKHLTVASPDYVAKFGAPETPEDLQRHRCLVSRMPGSAGMYEWRYRKGSKRFSPKLPQSVTVSDCHAAVEGAVGGAGIAYWVEPAFRRRLKRGALVPLLADWQTPDADFSLFYPTRHRRSKAMQLFAAHLVERARSARCAIDSAA